jgi:hypothetical protein
MQILASCCSLPPVDHHHPAALTDPWSPLDVFYYFNDDPTRLTANCTEHVDRGLVHVIVASDVQVRL